MKEYILQNKDKLTRKFKWTVIILTGGFIVMEFYNCYHANCSSTTQLTIGFIMTLLVLPIFFLVFEIIPGFIEYRRTDKFFETTSVNGLLKNGFKKDVDNKDSKWFLSKLILVGPFDKYEMICEIEQGRLRVIAKSNYDHLDNWDNKEIKAIQKLFSHVRFEYDGQGIATSLKMTKVKRMTFNDLQNYLGEFVKMLEKLKIE
jgi:hypothetical protein